MNDRTRAAALVWLNKIISFLLTGFLGESVFQHEVVYPGILFPLNRIHLQDGQRESSDTPKAQPATNSEFGYES
jgi:hypothetical protein